MSDWLDDFEMMGSKLDEGEKTLMRFAISKERRRIIKLLTTKEFGCPCGCRHWMNAEPVIALINGENK